MSFSDFSQISAAALGALLIWCFQLFDKITDRRRTRESTLVAIASEVSAICALIRAKGYYEAFSQQANNIRAEVWDETTFVIDVRGNYFKAFDAFVTSLAFLPPTQVSKIVSFYTYCQSAIDSTRPDGPIITSRNAEEKAVVVLGMEQLFREILELGDQIVQFPQQALPSR